MFSRRAALGRGSILVAAVAAAVLSLSGCGSNSSSPVTGSASAADSANTDQASMADIAFVQMMIPHHEQAVEMSQMALDPTSGASPAVQQMALDIEAAQVREIALMEQWLVEWGVPDDYDDDTDWPGPHTDDHMNGWGMADMMGMLSDEQIAELAAATETQFDRLWLEGMIAHHEGAVDMAEMVASESGDPAVNALAVQIITTQLGEIAEMEQLLGQLS